MLVGVEYTHRLIDVRATQAPDATGCRVASHCAGHVRHLRILDRHSRWQLSKDLGERRATRSNGVGVEHVDVEA